MAEGKTLKFQFVLDENSFQRVQRALAQLTKQAQEFAKAMQGSGGGLFGGANVGRPPTAAGAQVQGAATGQSGIKTVAVEAGGAFKGMARDVDASLKTVTASVRRNVDEQTRLIKNLKHEMAGLNRDVTQTRTLTGGTAGGFGGNYDVTAVTRTQGLTRAGTTVVDAATAITNAAPGGGGGGGIWNRLLQPVGGGGGAGGPGAGAGLNMGVLGQLLGSTNPLMIAGRTAMAIGAGGVGLANMSQGFNNGALDQAANRGQVINPALRRLRGGDISDILATKELASYSNEDKIQALKRSGSPESEFLKMVPAAAKAAANVLLMRGETGLGLSDDAQGTEKLKLVQETRDKIKEKTDYQQNLGRAYDYINDTASTRVQTSRILGRGFYDKTKDKRGDNFSEWSQRLTSEGYNEGEAVAATIQARQLGGRQFAGKYSDAIMRANAAGYGDYGGMLAQAGRSGGLGRAGNFAGRALGGGIDTGAGIQLGNAVYGFDPRGTMSGGGFMNAVQSGMQFTGGIQDYNAVARVQGAMRAGDALTAGYSPYAQSQNMIAAITALPGGSTYAQDSLAGKTSFKEMVGLATGQGERSDRAKAYGYGQEEAKSVLGDMIGGVFDQWRESGGDAPIDKLMRQQRESGQGYAEFLGDLGAKARQKDKKGKFTKEALQAQQDIKSLGVFASDVTGQNTEEAIGMMQIGAGTFNTVDYKKGKGPAGSIDDMSKKEFEAKVAQMKIDAEKLAANFKTVADAFDLAKDWTTKLTAVGALATNAQAAADSLAKLTGVTDAAIAAGKGSTTKDALRTFRKAVTAGAKSAAGAATTSSQDDYPVP